MLLCVGLPFSGPAREKKMERTWAQDDGFHLSGTDSAGKNTKKKNLSGPQALDSHDTRAHPFFPSTKKITQPKVCRLVSKQPVRFRRDVPCWAWPDQAAERNGKSPDGAAAWPTRTRGHAGHVGIRRAGPAACLRMFRSRGDPQDLGGAEDYCEGLGRSALCCGEGKASFFFFCAFARGISIFSHGAKFSRILAPAPTTMPSLNEVFNGGTDKAQLFTLDRRRRHFPAQQSRRKSQAPNPNSNLVFREGCSPTSEGRATPRPCHHADLCYKFDDC